MEVSDFTVHVSSEPLGTLLVPCCISNIYSERDKREIPTNVQFRINQSNMKENEQSYSKIVKCD